MAEDPPRSGKLNVGYWEISNAMSGALDQFPRWVVGIIVSYLEPEEVTMLSYDPALVPHIPCIPVEVPPKQLFCSSAARKGLLEVVKWAYQHGFPWDEKSADGRSWTRRPAEGGRRLPRESTSAAAAEGGHMEIITWATEMGCPVDSRVGRIAASAGNLALLQWLREKKFQWSGDELKAAATAGQIEVLGFLLSQGVGPSFMAAAKVCEGAAEGGHLRVLRWAKKHLALNGNICVKAADRGHLHILEWLRKQDERFISDEEIAESALMRGDVPMLRFIGCRTLPFLSGGQRAAAENGHLYALEYFVHGGVPDKEICDGAARGGHLDILQWYMGKKSVEYWLPPDSETIAEAAEGGHHDVVRWLRENGCPWDRRTIAGAVRGGHLGLLQWARANGCVWDHMACVEAAGSGHLFILQWLVGSGCPMDGPLVCSAAATGGHLPVLKWAYNAGHVPPERASWVAANNGHPAVLAWMDEQKIPLHKEICGVATIAGHIDILEWACERGLGWCKGASVRCAEIGHWDTLEYALAHGCPSTAGTTELIMRHKKGAAALMRLSVKNETKESPLTGMDAYDSYMRAG